MVTVIGPPVQVPAIPSPTDDQVKEWLAKYIDTLQALFEKYRGQYAPPGSEPLKII